MSNGAYRSLNIEFGNKHLLQRDDILVTKASGSLDHIGKAALATEEIVSLGASFGNFMQRLRINREIFLPEYICHFLRSTNARAQFQYMGTTSTGLFNISAELLNDLQVPVVSLSEQHNIVKSLEELESRFEARVSLIEESIKLFEEFKLATISEAITGKSMFESLKGLVNV
jgi:type I restriction enzyme S subunit